MKTLGNILMIAFVFLSVYAFRNQLNPVAQDIGNYIKGVSESLNTIPASTIPQISIQSKQPIANSNATTTTPSSHTASQSVTAPNSAAASGMTDASVIYWTNQSRAQNGNLPALTENSTLDATALAKAQDILAKQYFAHVSPTGMSVATQAQAAGYQYIEIGENLALGTFASGQDLVNAWMGSPEHRANILNTNYREIGVAVIKGQYQGNTVWVGVQHFGMPASACPSVDATLKATIDAGQATIASLDAQITAAKNLIDSDPNTTSSEYSQKIDAYNATIGQYNTLVTTIKSDITQYNNEVNTFNTCAGSL